MDLVLALVDSVLLLVSLFPLTQQFPLIILVPLHIQFEFPFTPETQPCEF